MKEIKIIILQNSKNLLTKYCEVEESLDIFQQNIQDKIIKLDIFKNLCENITIDIKQIFQIEIIDNNAKINFDINFFRFYDNKFYNNYSDFVNYGNAVYLKKELLKILENKGCNHFILPYNFKPKYDIDKKMNFGFELEISCGDSENLCILVNGLLEKNLLCNDKIILKIDGSIDGNNAVEIVTSPNKMKELCNIARSLSDIFKKFNSSAKGHNVGGMHIHCSYILNNIKILKLIDFMYNNENLKFLQRIAQRTNNEYCSSNLDNVCGALDLINVSLKKKKIKNYNRYGALNFTDNTIEFRIFNSNLRAERILKNLNFVEAVLNFIASKKYSNNYKDFINFVENCKKYKYLKEFIKYLNEE